MSTIFNNFLIILIISPTQICHSLQNTKKIFSPFQENYHDRQLIERYRKRKAMEILSSMNLEIDPCDDFYEYACGNYYKDNKMETNINYNNNNNNQNNNNNNNNNTDEEEMATMANIHRDRINTELRQLLEKKGYLEEETDNFRKLKEFHTSCVGALRNGHAQQTFFIEIINANGGFPAVPGAHWQVNFPNYNWVQVVAQLRRLYGMDILIGVTVDVNYQSQNENSIYLMEPSTLIPRPVLCSAQNTKRVSIHDEKYDELKKAVSERLIQWLHLNPEATKRLAESILMFEFELCTVMNDDVSDIEHSRKRGNYTRKTLGEYTRQFNDSIDFYQFIAISFRQPVNKPVYMSQSAEQYFTKLIKTIKKHPETTVANYIMYRALSSLSFPLDDTPSRRPQYCIQLIKRIFPRILGEMYYRRLRNPSVLSDINDIFEKIKQSFHESLHNSWLEESSSRVAKQILKDTHLVFPNYDDPESINFHTERNNYWKNLNESLGRIQEREIKRLYENGVLPKAYIEIESYDPVLQYRPPQRQLVVGLGMLRPPFYEHFYPFAIKYSIIGMKIAQELSLGFGEDSWSSERLSILNWDSFTAREYENRSKCFRQQLSNYLYNNPTQYNNKTQLKQFISASTSLNIAFDAYLTWLSYMNPNSDHATLIKETLPEINLTNTQLFFTTFAQMNCRRSQESEKDFPTYLPLLFHTLERYAVNGPIRNSPEFAKEFNCIPGSEMHPVDKCAVY